MKLLQNKKIAYLTAIFCTLLWGTAFPFIKVGYSAFKIEESDIGSKLILQECGLCWRDLWCFSFCGYQKENRRRFQKRYTARLFTRSGSDRIAVYFYIHRNRFYKRNEHLYNNGLCVVLYRTFRAVVFQKRQAHADEDYRLYSRIRRNYRNQFRRNCQHGHLVRRYDDSLFNNICGGRQHRCEKSHNRTRSVSCNRFSAFNRRFYIACVGHMLRWQYWFDKC